jgi:hypothetical protein
LRRQVLLTRLLLLEARSILLIGITLRLVFKVLPVTQDRLVTPDLRVRLVRRVRRRR